MSLRENVKGMGLFERYALLIAVLLFAAGLVGNAWRYETKYEKFMRECQQDHKEYECDTMWRVGR